MKLLTVSGLALLLAGLSGAPARASIVGSKAPELDPKEWINGKGNLSWASLKGRVILIEKWATW